MGLIVGLGLTLVEAFTFLPVALTAAAYYGARLSAGAQNFLARVQATLGITNRPFSFRSINPNYPPNQSALAATNSQGMQNMCQDRGIDCSDIAEMLLKAANGQGYTITVLPRSGQLLKVLENSQINYEYVFHMIYTDGKYVFDPRI